MQRSSRAGRGASSDRYHYTMIVGVLPFGARRPGQASGLPNHYTMIVGVLPSGARRPG